MAKNKRPRGDCEYCGRNLTRGGMARHLRACSEREEAIAEANQGKGKAQPLYHLQVQDAWGGRYWLHLEMRSDATLEALDHYLRAIWLECCGHLSAFEIDSRQYTQAPYGGHSFGDERGMNVKVREVFEPGMEFSYRYDFGTTSELAIKVADQREGKPTTSHPIALMARNDAPDATCQECDKPATYLCMECIYAEDKPGRLCDEHEADHPHGYNYGAPMPLVNSPRTGMCGYGGPAEPPY